MSTGKIASQAGHAFLGSFLNCKDPKVISEYHKDFPNSPGTKVCLSIPNLPQLFNIEYQAKQAGIPTFKVVDSGCENFFGGQPIVTALGIGPVTKDQIKHITGHLKLM